MYQNINTKKTDFYEGPVSGQQRHVHTHTHTPLSQKTCLLESSPLDWCQLQQIWWHIPIGARKGGREKERERGGEEGGEKERGAGREKETGKKVRMKSSKGELNLHNSPEPSLTG